MKNELFKIKNLEGNEESVYSPFFIGANWDADFGNNVCIFNCTPHPITIQDTNGDLISIASKANDILGAKAVEENVDDVLVKTTFIGNPEGEAILDRIKEFFETTIKPDYPKSRLIVIGSMIAAQAYPGRVVAMCPVPGYERVAPDMKRMRCDKFTTFAE